MGSGPFTLESYEPRVRAVLARSPGYWDSKGAGGGPFLDRIVINFLDSPAGAVNALRQGEAQMASLTPDPDLIKRADAIDGVAVQAVPSVFWEHLVLNVQAEPLTDPAVRRALAYAIDRAQVVKVLLDNSFPVAQSVLRPFQLGYEPAFDGYGYDPERARALLTAAGWTLGADGIFEKGGRKLEIPIVITAGDELRRTTVRLMADQAARAGIRLTRPLRAARHDLRRAARARGLHGRDVRDRGRPGALPHQPAGVESDPHGGERVHRPERVPVEQPRRRPPDAPLRPRPSTTRPGRGPSGGCRSSWPTRSR